MQYPVGDSTCAIGSRLPIRVLATSPLDLPFTPIHHNPTFGPGLDFALASVLGLGLAFPIGRRCRTELLR